MFNSGTHPRIDVSFLAGVAIAVGAITLGVFATGVSPRYFLQPVGAVIVLGGTAGVILLSTPRGALLSSARRAAELFVTAPANREPLLEEMVQYARIARRESAQVLESKLGAIGNSFLRQGLEMAIDINSKDELRALLETELRVRERQGESDAKALEVAGGFAPTIGIIGTVVGLIQVMRQFSDLASVASGIGMAFVSTIYGLALANLLLLPAANRIRARVAEKFETDEMVLEGVLCIAERLHPTLMRMRLQSFLRTGHRPRPDAVADVLALKAKAGH
ncbi:MAG TPA: MotA/TolQ/ExbB proton channel family protein [Bryobacteraceae bacterium]|nr:MotA/TolQ/ExbB proton channel family protein [Bryobacteraceae bacterium]